MSIRAPPGFRYPTQEELDYRAAKRRRLRNNLPPQPSHWTTIPMMTKRRNWKIVIDHKPWLYQERNIIAALNNFTNGTSLYQTIIARRWADANGNLGNPDWMGFDYPPITILITYKTGDKIYATVSCNNAITLDTIRSAIIHELKTIPMPRAVISVHFIGTDPFTKRYYRPHGLST